MLACIELKVTFQKSFSSACPHCGQQHMESMIHLNIQYLKMIPQDLLGPENEHDLHSW